jgi:hypothetical protein
VAIRETDSTQRAWFMLLGSCQTRIGPGEETWRTLSRHRALETPRSPPLHCTINCPAGHETPC